jgi:hypothetical protein
MKKKFKLKNFVPLSLAPALATISMCLLFMSATTCTPAWWASTRVTNFEKFHTCNPYMTGNQMIRLPILKNSWVKVPHCLLPEPKDISFSIVVFESEWTKTFGKSDALLVALNSLFIEMDEEDKAVTGYTKSGVKFIDAKIVGLARTPTWIWIHATPTDRLCQTSLVHELVHIALWADSPAGHGDPDHEGEKYPGWSLEHSAFIDRVNKMLCTMDL